jgi:hypothetical protein
MTKRRTWPLPVPTWTCPHCQHVHKPADLLRFDNDTLRCYACGKAFPDISGPPTGKAYIRQLEKIAKQWENAAADRESVIQNPDWRGADFCENNTRAVSCYSEGLSGVVK